ncbi:exported hypothetical protein [Vibrio crassostreae]|nr:exported hypothetical protein [Vibrio crassostreae]CAK1775968.1 exported hypothetical protein [Vibrio crassostreae]CAK1776844.1 exported hypothetical protein [Vibrio crassostreae]CAK2290786.1 exported hypothetical protein [Vibrio crassostreae]CAK2408254.1 exported hypothetical protein [Vibrio crassostreae]
MKKMQFVTFPLLLIAPFVIAEESVQDMSDPLAIYTQAGVGFTNHGINLKVGATYNTGVSTEVGMNIFEVKGFAGDSAGWSSSRERNNSIDSIRYRNFEVDLTNGRGSQVDINYATATNLGAQEIGTMS